LDECHQLSMSEKTLDTGRRNLAALVRLTMNLLLVRELDLG